VQKGYGRQHERHILPPDISTAVVCEESHGAVRHCSLYVIKWEAEEYNEMHELDRDEQIPDAISSGRLNFLRRSLIYVGPQYSSCCMSPF